MNNCRVKSEIGVFVATYQYKISLLCYTFIFTFGKVTDSQNLQRIQRKWFIFCRVYKTCNRNNVRLNSYRPMDYTFLFSPCIAFSILVVIHTNGINHVLAMVWYNFKNSVWFHALIS